MPLGENSEKEGQFEQGRVQKQIIVEGETFTFVKERDYSSIQIFKGTQGFLRIGPRSLILAELDKHNRLLSLGYPLPKVLSSGGSEDQYFYVEESFGDKHLGDLFSEDFTRDGVISEDHFTNFLEQSSGFAGAQLRTSQGDKDVRGFYSGINMDFILEELPDHRLNLTKAFEKIKEKTDSLPFVLTHGDLNPYNLFPKGIIDVGNVFSAPVGYDLVSNIYHVNNFPKNGDFEMLRSFDFSHEQRSRYFEQLDRILVQNAQSKVSDHAEEFVVCRAIWSSARMQRSPKLQQWRYNRLIRMVDAYLSGRSAVDIVLSEQD